VRFSGEGPGPHRVIAAGAVQVTVHDAERFDIEGGFGNDRLTGGASHDRLDGQGGANVLKGLGGNDRLEVFIDDFADTVNGGAGFDTLDLFSGLFKSVDMTGTGGSVVTVRTDGVEVVSGIGIERVEVRGGVADDTLLGLAADDILIGFEGDDRLEGRGGDDRLDGGRGTNVLLGGSGADTFVFTEGPRLFVPAVVNTILDFSNADRIEVDASAFGSALAPGATATLIAGVSPVAPAGSTAGVFLFDTATGLLSFDANGALGGGRASLGTLLNGGVIAGIGADQIDIV
jgi:Ca2+-binding RTX toxin-like protein